MRVSEITIKGLFDRFDHEIPFDPNETMVIMIGPNGIGKTMTLRIVDAIFNLRLRSLANMPFDTVEVLFDNDSYLKVVRIPSDESSGSRKRRQAIKVIYKSRDHDAQEFLADRVVRDDELSFPASIITDVVPVLIQIGPDEWQDQRNGEVLDLDGVLSDFGEYFPQAVRASRYPPWLEAVRSAIPVRFIGTERLTEMVVHRGWTSRSHIVNRRNPVERTVKMYSQKLADMIRQTLADYATESQNLERTFPVRLVEQRFTPEVSARDLEKQLAAVETKRSNIVDAGFLDDEELEGLTVPIVTQVDPPMRAVLSVYAQDALQKLSVFDRLYARVDTLKRIANDRLLYKQVSVGADGLTVTANGSSIDLEMLSSGEQHELVLICGLLLETAENSLILIDEPELSLHVAWQEKVLEDLEEMASLSNFQVLLATHSPEIIGDRWDLTVELKGPSK